jgi:hypothetical protein
MINYYPLAISKHGRERLKERYSFFEKQDVNSIISYLSQKDKYQTLTVNKSAGTVVREIKYKQIPIQAVVNVKKNIIVTFPPVTFVPTPENLENIQKDFTVKERLEKIESILEEILDKLKGI